MRYRAVAENVKPEPGFGLNGQAFAFHYALPVDSAGELPDGRTFRDIKEFKRLISSDEVPLPATSPANWWFSQRVHRCASRTATNSNGSCSARARASMACAPWSRKSFEASCFKPNEYEISCSIHRHP